MGGTRESTSILVGRIVLQPNGPKPLTTSPNEAQIKLYCSVKSTSTAGETWIANTTCS